MSEPDGALVGRVKTVAFVMGRLDAPFAVRAHLLEELALDEATIREASAQVHNLLRDEKQGALREAYRAAFARGRSGADTPEEKSNASLDGMRFLSEPLAFRAEAARVATMANDGAAPALLRPAPDSAVRGRVAPQSAPAFVAETGDLPAGFAFGDGLPFDPTGPDNQDGGETVVGVRLRTDATLPFAGQAGPMQDPPTEFLSLEHAPAPATGLARPSVDETAVPSGSGSSPVLPFGDSGRRARPARGAAQAAVLRLTLEQYASLCAELIVHGGASTQTIYDRYGIASDADGAAINTLWQRRFESDARLHASWKHKRDAYVAWLRKSGASP